MATITLNALRYPGQTNPQLASADAVAVQFDPAGVIPTTIKAATDGGAGGSKFLYRQAGQSYRCRVLQTTSALIALLNPE
jgi:hypothetical protein